MKKLGFVGFGLRSETMMKAFKTIEADVCIAAIADPRHAEIKEKYNDDSFFKSANYYDDIDQMLAGEKLDGVFVGTRCSLHTDYACKVLALDLPLFLEKPVCINEQQLNKLRDAAKGKENKVVVSFPLRLSPLVIEVKRIIDSGSIGKLTMVQAINNVPYGSVYYHSWYRDDNETGGLFLQKMTHDIDYIHYLMGEKTVSASATTAKLHYKGNKPAGLKCIDCDEYHTCSESSYVVKNILKEEVTGEYCCFAKDTGNEDCAAAIFKTPSGVIVSYNQNFIVKKSAARRGARFVGTMGSVEFDFYTGEIREDRYLTPDTITHKFEFGNGAHFGGDEYLALDFMGVLNGENAKSNLSDGIIAASACLAAKKSDQSKRFIDFD